MKLEFFVKLMKWSSTIILSVGVKYSLRDLLFDVNNYMPDLPSSDMRHTPTMLQNKLVACYSLVKNSDNIYNFRLVIASKHS